MRSAGSLVVSALLAVGASLPAAQQTFRGGTDLVHLPIVVTAKNGDLVRGLTAADFEVREDGQAQRIALFAEGAPGERLPLHLGLLLDISESMDAVLKDASDAAVRFVNALDEAVDVTFMDFDTGIRAGRFSPPDYPRLFERIRSRKARGATALYDAISQYLQGTVGREGQHVLLAYTDGGDTTSSTNFGKLQERLRLAHVLMYLIAYMDEQPRTAEDMLERRKVMTLARETGGDAFFPQSPEEIHTIYARILDELMSRYTIGYVPARAGDGKFHKVEVRLTRPDLREAKVRTRPGYMATR